MSPLLTIDETASLLAIAPCTLRRRVARNEVPHRRLMGRMIRFTQADIDAILEQAYRPVREPEEKRLAVRGGHVFKWVRT